MKALSVIAPFGSMIATLNKKLEIRKWVPEEIPLENLLLVENQHRLNKDFQTEMGKAVAIIDVIAIKKWEESDLVESCCSKYEDGYYAWKISNVRKIEDEINIIAKKKIYSIEHVGDSSFEQNYQIGNEIDSVIWNINKIKQYLESKRSNIFNVNTESVFSRINRNCIDKAYALTTNENAPIIIVELEKNKQIVIDGNHRIYKSHLLALPKIKAVLLTIEEQKTFINGYNQTAYNNVINTFPEISYKCET